jgi:tetratricopeptide (TPR) repeat protein
VTLPAALFAYEALFYGAGNPLKLYRREPRRLLKYLLLAVIFAAYVIFRFLFLRGFFRRVVSSGEISGVTAWSYLLTQFRAWVYYLRLFVWPHRLITDFPGFGWSHRISEPAVLASLAIIVVILALAWRVRTAYPVATFFTLWFFIALLPEASFLPLLDPVTGYRAYLAYVGVSVVASFLLLAASGWMAQRIGRIGASRLACGAMAVVLVALSAATAVRNRVWSDETTLWSDVVEKDPSNARAYVNLALLSIQDKDYAKARDLLEAATAHAPRNGYATMIRGYLTYVLEQDDYGASDFTTAIRLEPRLPMPYYYRGEAYRRRGDYNKALGDYTAAIERQPFYADAYMGIALVRMDKGERDAAAAACEKIIAIDPRDARGYNCLGILLLEQNRAADAVRIYQKGVLHAAQNGGLWYGLGLAYERNNMYREAGEAFARSSELTR